jgi:pSer/pThr/pTyr-binding forkhead associated (FHA) protein
MKARLAAYRDGKLQATYPLPEPGTTIGRDAENHIQLNHPMVSRRHSAIHAKDGMWVIKDLSSTNGVQVNGAPVTNAVLKNGDAIGIGPFYLVFETAADGAEWAPAGSNPLPTSRRLPTIPEGREIRPAPNTMPIRLVPPKPDPSKGGGTGS